MITYCDHCEKEMVFPDARETTYAYWCKECCETDKHLLDAIGSDNVGHWEESYPRVRSIPKSGK